MIFWLQKWGINHLLTGIEAIWLTIERYIDLYSTF
jgi:hypothetical protein